MKNDYFLSNLLLAWWVVHKIKWNYDFRWHSTYFYLGKLVLATAVQTQMDHHHIYRWKLICSKISWKIYWSNALFVARRVPLNMAQCRKTPAHKSNGVHRTPFPLISLMSSRHIRCVSMKTKSTLYADVIQLQVNGILFKCLTATIANSHMIVAIGVHWAMSRPQMAENPCVSS